MTFAELYAYANGQPGPFISVRTIADRVQLHHVDIGEVHFWPVELDPNISLGHMLYEQDRSSAYGDEFRIANIRYHRHLNRCWRRFVCCKELMHVFDDEAQRANSKEKFIELLRELESTPLPGARSAMYESEIKAIWMAMMVLCPETIRNNYLQDWLDKAITDYDVASALRIPEAYVSTIMGAQFESVRDMLLG